MKKIRNFALCCKSNKIEMEPNNKKQKISQKLNIMNDEEFRKLSIEEQFNEIRSGLFALVNSQNKTNTSIENLGIEIKESLRWHKNQTQILEKKVAKQIERLLHRKNNTFDYYIEQISYKFVASMEIWNQDKMYSIQGFEWDGMITLDHINGDRKYLIIIETKSNGNVYSDLKIMNEKIMATKNLIETCTHFDSKQSITNASIIRQKKRFQEDDISRSWHIINAWRKFHGYQIIGYYWPSVDFDTLQIKALLESFDNDICVMLDELNLSFMPNLMDDIFVNN